MKHFLRDGKEKLRLLRACWQDAQNISTYNVMASQHRGDARYAILLIVHSLEKGMCMPELRPFGQEKAERLMAALTNYPNPTDFEYEMGMSILEKWVDFFQVNGWEDAVCSRVKEFLKGKNFRRHNVGRMLLKKQEQLPETFADVIFTRHSIRSFSTEKINKEDLAFAVECFRHSPSACNRQMCRIIQIESSSVKQLLDCTIHGVSGFDLKSVQFFVITYDLNFIKGTGERSQGNFNAGLASMNFVNALHSRGIGSCFMQWSNDKEQDELVRKAMNLPDSERIAVVIAAGYYPDETVIPCSARRSSKELLRRV